jgi:membrane protein
MNVPEEGVLRLLFEVGRRSTRKYLRHDDMNSYAAALAYRALFAMVPFLALLVGLVGLLGIGDFFIEWLADQIHFPMEGQIAEIVRQWINQTMSLTQGERLSIGLVVIGVAVWSISSGVRTLTKALNHAYDAEDNRPSWKRYGLSFFYALGLAVMVIVAATLLFMGPRTIEWIVGRVGLDEAFVSLWTWLRLPVALVLLMLVVSIVYWTVPNANHAYRFISPGAVLAVIGWVLASLGFSFYIVNFANYSVIYGSIGVIFVLLLYFYISAAVLLFGAEVNVAIHHYALDRHMEIEEHKTAHEARDADDRRGKDN